MAFVNEGEIRQEARRDAGVYLGSQQQNQGPTVSKKQEQAIRQQARRDWEAYQQRIQPEPIPEKPLLPDEETRIREGARQDLALYREPPQVREKPERLPFAKIAVETLKGAGGDIGRMFKGITEAGFTLATGIPSYILGVAGQTGKTIYELWKTGFKDIETLDPSDLFPQLLERVGEEEKTKEAIAQWGTYQPESELGGEFAGIAVAPIELYFRGVEKVAELTTDNPKMQKGIKYLGDLALLFAVPKAKAYLKESLRTKTPIALDKIKAFIEESKKVPERFKEKAREIKETIPEESALAEEPIAETEVRVSKEADTGDVVIRIPTAREGPLRRAPKIKAEKIAKETIEKRIEKMKEERATEERRKRLTFREMVEPFAKRAATREELEAVMKEAYEDRLTGVGNFAAYNESPRTQAEAVLDFDNLKQLNDKVGHDEVNNMIRKSGEVFRKHDSYRYGGDEFVIKGKRQELERTLPNIEKELEEIGFKVSWGIGETFDIADKAMYRMKAEHKKPIEVKKPKVIEAKAPPFDEILEGIYDEFHVPREARQDLSLRILRAWDKKRPLENYTRKIVSDLDKRRLLTKEGLITEKEKAKKRAEVPFAGLRPRVAEKMEKVGIPEELVPGKKKAIERAEEIAAPIAIRETFDRVIGMKIKDANKKQAYKDWLDGLSSRKSAEKVGVSHQSIANWRKPWAEEVKKREVEFKSILEEEKGKALEKVMKDLDREVSEVQRLRYPKPGLALEPTVKITEAQKFKFDKKIEDRFEAARGLKRETASQKIGKAATTLKNSFTRAYLHMPNTAYFIEAKQTFSHLAKQKPVAWDKATRVLHGITIRHDSYKHDLFRRKIILDDLVGEEKLGHDLPFGFTARSLNEARLNLQVEIAKYPEVMDAVRKRTAVMDAVRKDYIYWQEKIGHHVEERMKKPDYFRHQILQHADTKGLYTTGRRLRKPMGRGFLKERKGSQYDINTDYLEAESEVLAQIFYDIEVAKAFDRIEKNYDISAKIKKEAKKQGLEDWHEAIKEGYSTFQPQEGNVFYMAHTIPEKLAKEIMQDALSENLNIAEGKIRQALVMGRRRKEWVIKEELAKQLNELTKPKAPHWFKTAIKAPTRLWKIQMLVSPRRFPKYNIRNLTGDGVHVFLGNPSTFRPKNLFKSGSEIYKYLVGKEPVEKVTQEWIDRGGFHTTLPAQEISKLKMFKDLYEGKKSVKDLPTKTWKSYWRTARLLTDMREALLRLSAFYDYREQMKAHPEGRPKNFGASLREEIMGLKNVNDRAFRLSNELLGAYDEVSVSGGTLRDYIIPFWSWKELNFKIYVRLMKNAAKDGRLPSQIGKTLAVRTPLMALRVGRFALKATGFWTILQVYNNLRFPEEEADLPKDVRNRPHIVLGRDEETGEVQYFSRIGALGDFLEWFGLDAAPGFVSDYLNGRKTIKEIAGEMAKSPVNVVVQGVSPFIKGWMELATRRSLFPDVFNPRTIRNRTLHFMRELALEEEYKAISGLPSKPYKETLGKFLYYEADPLETAYHEIYDLKREFLKKVGKDAEGFWITPRGNALYYMKLAHRYGLKDDENKYLKEYISYHVKEFDITDMTEKEFEESVGAGILSSLTGMNPLSGLNKREVDAFIEWLNPEEKEILAKAFRFYSEVLIGTSKFKD